MGKATDLDRQWIEASKPVVKEILAKAAPVRTILASWVQQGADPHFLWNLVEPLREEHGLRREAEQDSRVRKAAEAFGRHMERAWAAFQRIDRLAFTSDYVGGAVLAWFRQPLQELTASAPALRGRPLPRGRLGERHITRVVCALAEHLRERTGRPRWGEIAKLVNDLRLVEKRVTRRDLEDRCRSDRYRRRRAAQGPSSNR
ncbi:MAG TPA: hypothetical protein VGC81_10520 [Candidatus Methylomirabilis sp.]